MGYKRTIMDDAKDELFAHMQRCKVPGATEEDVREWMHDTRRFLADRYPQLTEAQLASLETIGRRYAQPAIPHGKDATARNRDEWESATEAAHSRRPDESDGDVGPTGVPGETESGELQTA